MANAPQATRHTEMERRLLEYGLWWIEAPIGVADPKKLKRAAKLIRAKLRLAAQEKDNEQ